MTEAVRAGICLAPIVLGMIGWAILCFGSRLYWRIRERWA
jgi:hypothetical protein